MKEQQKFKVGDLVEWTSQANGRTTTKRGEVFYIVKPWENPAVTHFNCDADNEVMFDGGIVGRGHESYLVSVKNGNKKPRMYWPVVSRLRVYADVGVSQQ